LLPSRPPVFQNVPTVIAEAGLGDGGSAFLENIGTHLRDLAASEPRRLRKHDYHFETLKFQIVNLCRETATLISTGFISTTVDVTLNKFCFTTHEKLCQTQRINRLSSESVQHLLGSNNWMDDGNENSFGSRGSALSTVSDYGLDSWGSIPDRGGGSFF
jgi:hypothetical protein